MSFLFNQSVFFNEDLSSLNSLIKSKNFSKVFILVDINTANFCLPLFDSFFPLIPKDNIIQIPVGEDFKSLETAQFVWSKMFGADRKSLLINFGGGVVSDLGGFVASLFKRGISFINIPTTLLSMVDAAVGGKTGVNFNGYKNHLGLISNPLAVYIDLVFLNSLPENHLRAAWAEILKTAIIYNHSLFDDIISQQSNLIASQNIIKKSLESKLAIVQKDPTEKSTRKLLNFGHTIGHALESYSFKSDFNFLLHGEAVFMGLIAESFIAFKLNLLSINNLNLIVDVVKSYYPVSEWLPFDETEVLFLMIEDKKNMNSKINFSLPSNIGSGVINQFPSKDIIVESLRFLKSLC